MGCGASNNDVIKSVSPKTNLEPQPREKANGVSTSNGSHQQPLNNLEFLNSTSSVNSEGSTIPANEFYQNNLNDGSNQGKHLGKTLPPLKPPRSTVKIDFIENQTKMEKLNRPEPIAFEVPAEDEETKEETGSLVKRHPPRRLRKTIEEQTSESLSLTQEVLEEKVQLANERRTQVLHQRVASARQKSARNVNRVRDNRPFLESENYLSEFGENNETAK